MSDREKMLLDALKKMTWQYSVYDNGILYDLLASDEGTPAIGRPFGRPVGGHDGGATYRGGGSVKSCRVCTERASS